MLQDLCISGGEKHNVTGHTFLFVLVSTIEYFNKYILDSAPLF